MAAYIESQRSYASFLLARVKEGFVPPIAFAFFPFLDTLVAKLVLAAASVCCQILLSLHNLVDRSYSHHVVASGIVFNPELTFLAFLPSLFFCKFIQFLLALLVCILTRTFV